MSSFLLKWLGRFTLQVWKRSQPWRIKIADDLNYSTASYAGRIVAGFCALVALGLLAQAPHAVGFGKAIAYIGAAVSAIDVLIIAWLAPALGWDRAGRWAMNERLRGYWARRAARSGLYVP